MGRNEGCEVRQSSVSCRASIPLYRGAYSRNARSVLFTESLVELEKSFG